MFGEEIRAYTSKLEYNQCIEGVVVLIRQMLCVLSASLR